MAEEIIPKEILRKEPFKRILPSIAPRSTYITNDIHASIPVDNIYYEIVSQADFLREYYVSGHKINSRDYYPDIFKDDPNTGKMICEIVPRCAFAFQYIITIKQLCHLCGNNIEFKISTPIPTQKERNALDELIQGWISKNMEIAWYEAARSEKITGDAAICFFMYKGKLHWRRFSYIDGDVLFPHYDDKTGILDAFARKYIKYDEKGKRREELLEVWDDKNYYKFKRDTQGLKGKVNSILTFFGLDGWIKIEEAPHNFPRIPIAYKRSDIGACWSLSQNSIDSYELAVSQLCKNNESYAFPILYIFGEGETDIKGSSNGRPSVLISNNSDTKAGFIERQHAADAFKLQLDILSENIFRGSFAVNPPEIKGGDMPGITVKLIYSPALEKAMADANEWNSFIDDMVELFKYGYGIEMGKLSDFASLNVRGEIIPYIHQNVAEVVSNLVQLVSSGILSKESASSQTTYGANGEWKRIMQEERNNIMGLGRTTDNTVYSEYSDGMNEYNEKEKLIAEAKKEAS